MNIPYCNKIKILGFYFTDRVNVANKETWSNITSQVRAAAQVAYYRDLSLDARIRYVHEYLLARIWYVAHIFPLPTDSMRQLNTAISWFLCRGEIFRVPLSTLYRGKVDEGWDLVVIWAKSVSIFLHRMQLQGKTDGSFTADWLSKWDTQSRAVNPP